MAQNPKKNNFVEKKVKLVWGSAQDIPIYYANHIQITHGGGLEFHITYGHLRPPLTHGLKDSELPDTVEIMPVVTLVISPQSMVNFVEVIKGNLDNYLKSVKKEEK